MAAAVGALSLLAALGCALGAAAPDVAGMLLNGMLRREADLEFPSQVLHARADGAAQDVSAQLLEQNAVSSQVCDTVVTMDTCRVLRHDAPNAPPFDMVSLSQIRAAFGACPEGDGDVVENILFDIGFEDVDAGNLSCSALCKSLQEYFVTREFKRFVVPTSSDSACYEQRDGTMVCDLVVVADDTMKEMENPTEFYGQKGDEEFSKNSPGSGSSLIAKYANETRAQPKTSATKIFATQEERAVAPKEHERDNYVCPWSGIEAIVRLAQLFRFYPKQIGVNTVEPPDGASMTDIERLLLWRSLAKAEAWTALTLRSMIAKEDLKPRKTFFGSEGPLSDSEVGSLLWRRFGFVLKEFIFGVHVVYPGVACASEPSLQAYVLVKDPASNTKTVDGLKVNSLGCSKVGCGLQPVDNRYFVYFCPRVITTDAEPVRTSVFVHEVTHHSGPVDVTYKLEKLKALQQQEQLSNAPNYQWFAKGVVEREAKAEGGSTQQSWPGSSIFGSLFGGASPRSAAPGPAAVVAAVAAVAAALLASPPPACAASR